MRRASIASFPVIGSGDIAQNPIQRNQRQLSPAHEITFWEENNPKCVINMVTDKLREYMRALPPEMLSAGAKDLRKRLDPGWTVEQLRIAFWDEFFLTVDNDHPTMRMAAVYGKICNREHFYDLIKHPLTLAYMLQPPADYMYKMRALLDMGLERFHEVLNMDVAHKDGSANTKLITEIIKIVALVDNRVKGAVAQKLTIDQTSKNLNYNVNQEQAYEAPKSAREIQLELSDIEKQIKILSNGGRGELESGEEMIFTPPEPLVQEPLEDEEEEFVAVKLTTS